MQKCVEFSIGKSIKEIINIEITPDDNLPEIRNLIEYAWCKCGRPEEIFVFSDLKGATPCNGLLSWLKEKNIFFGSRFQIDFSSI